MIARVCAAAVVLALAIASAQAESAADHYHWRSAAPDALPRPYAVLLPGSSGLKIFDDDQHYFRAAARLNALGVDALVIDYHKAVKFVPAAKKGEAGARMALIIDDALAAMRAQGRAVPECPFAVIGWSLGGEGAWAAAARPAFAKAVIAYYPTTRAAKPYRNVAPILVLQGRDDNVTPYTDVDAFVASRSADSALVTIKAFDGAPHGFDVQTIPKPKTVKFPPMVGKKATFGYNAAAAAAAARDAETFLEDQGIVDGVCSA